MSELSLLDLNMSLVAYDFCYFYLVDTLIKRN